MGGVGTYRGCGGLFWLGKEGAIEDVEGPYSWGAYGGCGGLFCLGGGDTIEDIEACRGCAPPPPSSWRTYRGYGGPLQMRACRDGGGL